MAFLLPALALAAPTAAVAATPTVPRLVLTEPSSSEAEPATTTTPVVLGEAEPEDGIILEGVPFFTGSGLGPVTQKVEKPTANPNYEIEIFASTECQGSVIGEGTAEELEGVGIPVTVEANARTSLTAKQIDPSDPTHPSGCSNVLSYWEGNVPPESGGGETGGEETGTPNPGGSSPGGSSGGSSGGGSIGGTAPAPRKPAAPNLHMVPSERANDATPLVAGSAPGAEAVAIYAAPNCGGSPVAKGTPAQLAAGFAISVPLNASTTFSAVSLGEQHSGCSEPVTYTEDSTAPRTRITMGPGVKTRKHNAVFRFTDITEDPPGTTYICRVNKSKWRSCSSPFYLKHLKPRHYTLAIRATDLAGNVEPKPVKRSFTVIRHR